MIFFVVFEASNLDIIFQIYVKLYKISIALILCEDNTILIDQRRIGKMSQRDLMDST
jgi:hypothetical protein